MKGKQQVALIPDKHQQQKIYIIWIDGFFFNLCIDNAYFPWLRFNVHLNLKQHRKTIQARSLAPYPASPPQSLLAF